MKVLEIGFCCAGIPEIFADALDTEHVRFSEHPFGYRAKKEIDLTSNFQITRPLNRYILSMADIESRFFHFFQFLKIIREYNLLHFHFNSIFPLYLDFCIYRAMGKKIILHYHGDDIRGKSYKNWFSFLADRIFVSTVDLLKYAPEGAEWVPNPIDLEKFPFVGTKNHAGPVTIVHAPSHRQSKGTDLIIKAVKDLEEEGYQITFILVEGMPLSRAMEIYRSADIVVDQVNPRIGLYGLVSIENMALGKPVLCSIHPEYEFYLPDLPIVRVRPETLKDRLRMVIEDPDLRQGLGREGRQYVEKYHDAKKIGARYFGAIL